MILLIGLGNPTRQDDSAGWAVIQRLSKMEFSRMETRLLQQLSPELVEDWNAYDRVLLVDATSEKGEVDLHKVEEMETTPSASSHHCKPETLLRLGRALNGTSPLLYLCKVPGEAFGIGDQLSSLSAQNVKKAVRLIQEWIGLKEGSHA